MNAQPHSPNRRTVSGTRAPLVRRWVAGLLTLLVGLSLSLAAFVMIRDRLHDQRLGEWSDTAKRHAQVIQNSLVVDLEALRSIGVFYAASRHVDRGQFAEFVHPILSRQPEVYAFGWIARVPQAERVVFEAAARAEGVEQFRIVEHMEGGSLTDASARPEYFPVTFTEPAGPNRALLGFDIASLPDRLAAMERARDSGEPASTDLVSLLSAPSEYGVVIFLPIYRQGLPCDTVEQRRTHLLGFAAVGFTVPEAMKAALAKVTLAGMALVVEPPWSEPPARMLYRYPEDVWQSAPLNPDDPQALASGGRGSVDGRSTVTEAFDLAGRTWSIRCLLPMLNRRDQDWPAWAALTVGALFTLLLTAYLTAILGRQETIETLIVKRTAEWAQANQQLQQQMAQRLRLEQEQERQHETLQRANQELAAQQEAMRALLEDLQGSKTKLETHNQELASREQVMQNLLEDLSSAKERIEQQADTLRAANEKMKGLAMLKDEFIAKVSHELRTPLTSVKEGISLMLDGALGATTADQQDFLATMDGDIDRLTELINNMLDISKIEAGRMRLFRTRLDLQKLVESVLKSCQALLGQRAVRVDAATSLSPVFGDANRLTQVFINLLSNAVKFTEGERGQIVFRLESRNGMVAVAVQDNGPGIAPEDLTRMFQKFSQVGQPVSGGHRGTGLGLVVCKELTELHGGRIEIASILGQGTTFTVSLPAYSDRFALEESFREQFQAASAQDGPAGVSLVAVDTRPLLSPAGSPAEQAAALEQAAAEVRQHLHRGDMVLPVEPAWVVALSAANAQGAKAIVKRLREKLRQGGRLRFGAAVHPSHGPDAAALLAYAEAHLDQELGAVEPSAPAEGRSGGVAA